MHCFGPTCNVFANQGHIIAIINEGGNGDRCCNAGSRSWSGYIDEFPRNLRISGKSLSELCQSLPGQVCGKQKAEDSSLHSESKERRSLDREKIVRSFCKAEIEINLWEEQTA